MRNRSSQHPRLRLRQPACWLFLFSGLVGLAVCTRLDAAVPPATTDATNGNSRVDFTAEVKPLLQARCVQCHGIEMRKADLNLSTPDGIRAGGESGAVVVPFKPDESLLYERTHGGEMPPSAKDRLTESQLDVLRRWIEQGASTGPANTAKTESETPTDVDQHSVLPILLRRCAACHGRNKQEANLDLRSRESMLAGGASGPAMILGKPDDSLLVQRVRRGEMPPADRLVDACVKPMEAAELETVVHWIAAGAPETDVQPDVATGEPDPLVSEQDRDFWAFRPPQSVTAPVVAATSRVRNPIDAFILDRLESHGMTLSPDASRQTLLRRVTFDLTGMPPSPEDAERFLADTDPNAYETLVDRLLASPRFGEHWARHWLDLAGYADSEGKREQDLPRPHAWRYRDYVIRAFNSDKPFDRFLTEQIAGDELADYETAAEITPEIYDNLVATGFLRMTPDASWANITGYLPDRIEVIADEIDVLGSAVLGLTMKCARCHSHKFDPIPQRDYYRLTAIFKGAYDEHDWLKPDIRPGIGPVSVDVVGGRHLPHVTTQERRAWEANEFRISQEIAAAKERSEPDEKIKALEAERQPEPRIQALWDRGEPTPTYVYRRGDPFTHGRLVGPGVPSVLSPRNEPFVVSPPWPGAKQTGRRLALARWLTQPDHPLVARVRVNQLWHQLFGRGIVRTLANFGKTGSPPSHPELLDWLAVNFVNTGWSTKSLLRQIVTSSTYRQSSSVTDRHLQLDPENTMYSRKPLTRLSAEELYDAILFAAGQLDETPFGPADPVQIRADGLVTPVQSARGWRRLIYVQQLRKQLATHLENFDYPQMNPNCVERRDSMVAPQALHLMNNSMVAELSQRFASRVLEAAGSDPRKQVDRAYWIALSRAPNADELRLGETALQQFIAQWTLALQETPDAHTTGIKALTSYCHVILNSAEFLFVD